MRKLQKFLVVATQRKQDLVSEEITAISSSGNTTATDEEAV